MTNADKGPTRPAPAVPDALLLPNGTRITRHMLRCFRLSEPPIVGRTPAWRPGRLRLYVVFDPEGQEVGELWFTWPRGLPQLGRTQFIKAYGKKPGYDECGEISVAAQDQDWARIDAIDTRVLPWYCRSCNRNYGESLWRILPQRGADGRIGSYGGVCPRGHRRVIAE